MRRWVVPPLLFVAVTTAPPAVAEFSDTLATPATGVTAEGVVNVPRVVENVTVPALTGAPPETSCGQRGHGRAPGRTAYRQPAK